MNEAAWSAPSASRIAVLGVWLGVAGGRILGALLGAGFLVIDALVDGRMQRCGLEHRRRADGRVAS